MYGIFHYSDVIMGAIASHITGISIVYSTVYSGANQRKHKALRHWPLWGEFTGERWIPLTRASNADVAIWWIQTGVTVRKRPIFRSKSPIFFVPCDLQIWQVTLKNNRAPLISYFRLCASFRNHRWIQTGATVRKRPIWVKIGDLVVPCDLKIWRMALKN